MKTKGRAAPKWVDVCTVCLRAVVVVESSGFPAKQVRCEHGHGDVVRFLPQQPEGHDVEIEAYQRGHTDGSNHRLAEFKRAEGRCVDCGRRLHGHGIRCQECGEKEPYGTPSSLIPDPLTGQTPQDDQREYNRLLSERLDATLKSWN